MLPAFLKSLRSVVLSITHRNRSYAVNYAGTQGRKPTAMHESDIVPAHHIALQHLDRVAIKDTYGSHTYLDVLQKAVRLSNLINDTVGPGKSQERIGFLCPNDSTYIISQWACWAAGHIAVPLSPVHPPSLLGYYIKDCNAALLIASQSHSKLLSAVKKTVGNEIQSLILEESWQQETKTKCMSSQLDSILSGTKSIDFYRDSDAMMLYTSGTTGKPKGVLLSHKNINAQVRMLIKVWQWTKKDVIVHALPLHHTHGVINALLCPLYVGASCIMLPKFDSKTIWDNFLNTNVSQEEKPTLFMGVPTMYSKLLAHYDTAFGDNPRTREYVKASISNNIRVMISGSAALPEPVFHKWKAATGLEIVERYGMTEIGSVLSIPLDGERRAGYVGVPSPGVSIRLVEFQPSSLGAKANYQVLFETSHEQFSSHMKNDKVISGDLLIKGPNVFKCYWNKPEATAKDFTADGWFRTGDAAQFDNGYFKILGRLSADIIKSGGFKISALEIETHLLGHPEIADCTVFGIPDVTWGQKVAAVLVLVNPEKSIDLVALKKWCKERMAPYIVPSEWRIYSELPRNALGKVNKVEFAKVAFSDKPVASKL